MINRDEEMIDLFKSGTTIIELSGRYGVSRQRVQQIMKKAGLSSRDGGCKVRNALRGERFDVRKDQRCREKYGCSLEQYRGIVAERNNMKAAGKSWHITPLAAYLSQKGNAKYRGIPFRLTLWEWWSIWQESGRWEERGLGMRGYVMCRRGDQGAYEVGNVFIDTSLNNVANAKRKARDLPMGVSARARQDRTVYAALRSINGKLTYLGTFGTPDEAHCAYLKAV